MWRSLIMAVFELPVLRRHGPVEVLTSRVEKAPLSPSSLGDVENNHVFFFQESIRREFFLSGYVCVGGAFFSSTCGASWVPAPAEGRGRAEVSVSVMELRDRCRNVCNLI